MGTWGWGGRGRGTRSWGWEGWRLVREAWLGLLLAAGEVGRSLVVFDVDGGGDVVLEQGRDRPPGSELKTDGLPDFARHDVDDVVGILTTTKHNS